MPKLTPDRLPAKLSAVLQEIRPPRRVKHLQAKIPSNFHDSLMQAALVCPRNTDIAAFYYVSEEIFANWRKEDPRIDVVVAQARQADTQEVMQAVRKRAVEGSAPHAKIYLERMRPDLNETPSLAINTNVKVTVLPPPHQSEIRTPATIKGSATRVPANTNTTPEDPKPPPEKTPLFGGKEVGPPAAAPARGLRR
jgi:hypothetical protein